MEHYENQSSSNLDLAQFDDAFETAEVEEREFEAVPDGKYQVNVDRVELTRAQTSAIPYAQVDPAHSRADPQGPSALAQQRHGQQREHQNGSSRTSTPAGCSFRSSPTCRATSSSFSTSLEVTKRTRGENENIYFNRRIVMADDARLPARRWTT